MSTFFRDIKTCLKDKFLVTGGRSSRREYWSYASISFIVFICVGIVIRQWPTAGIVINVVSFIFFIGLYTATVRRLHDSNRSNKHLLPILAGMILLITGIFALQPVLKLVGEVVLGLSVVYVLVLCALPSTPGDNQFGPQSN